MLGARVGQQSPAIARQHLQMHITDGIVAEWPARARASFRPGGRPRTGNADNAHAGPGLAPQSREAVTGRMRSAEGPPRGHSSRPHSAPRRVDPGSAWVAVTRNGSFVQVIAAHDLDELRAELKQAEAEESVTRAGNATET